MTYILHTCLDQCMYPQGCLKNQSIQTLHSFHPYFSHFLCLKLAYSMPGQPSFGCQVFGGFFGFTTRAGSIYGGNESPFHDSNHAQHLQNLRDLHLRKIMGWLLFQRKSAKSVKVFVCLFLYIFFFMLFFFISHAVHGLFLVCLGWR